MTKSASVSTSHTRLNSKSKGCSCSEYVRQRGDEGKHIRGCRLAKEEQCGPSSE